MRVIYIWIQTVEPNELPFGGNCDSAGTGGFLIWQNIITVFQGNQTLIWKVKLLLESSKNVVVDRCALSFEGRNKNSSHVTAVFGTLFLVVLRLRSSCRLRRRRPDGGGEVLPLLLLRFQPSGKVCVTTSVAAFQNQSKQFIRLMDLALLC